MIYLFVAYTRVVTFWLRKTTAALTACSGPGRQGSKPHRGLPLALAIVLDLPMTMLPAALFVTMITYVGWSAWWY